MALFRGNLKYSDVTAKADFLNRRQIIAGAAGIGAASIAGGAAQAKALEFTKTDYSVDLEKLIEETNDALQIDIESYFRMTGFVENVGVSPILTDKDTIMIHIKLTGEMSVKSL